MASSPAGMKTTDSAFSPTGSGCGWCGEVKQTKAEAKARADGGDAERRGRQWRGGTCGSSELRCALLRLLLGRDGTERRARERSGAEQLVKGVVGATERHPAASAGIRSPQGGCGLRAVECGRVRTGAHEGRRGTAWAWLRPVGRKWSAWPTKEGNNFSFCFSNE
jgi:hypothetical protein